ncbi:MAG: peptidoglycan-associated lipoprotein Pal [Deltaproteobacteria bacterium]|nr:MAG: peptidoglycan-associated lipoprotein Pal [Deltaproteobacteria bacterium]
MSVSCAKRATTKGEGEMATKPEVVSSRPEIKGEKVEEIKEEVIKPEEGQVTETEMAKAEEAGREMMAKEEITFEDIHFDFDKYFIRDDAKPILEKLGKYLLENPSVKVLIEGHCDERGTNEYNMALGEKRAQAAKNYLVGLGVSPDRIDTISYGEERPLDPRHNEEAWAKNRRAHFNILR